MRWSYKTIHYELKKEGLLGNTFLDEVEVEESLNEFGHAGWELVSLIEVKDGLIGVLKQPLDQPITPNVLPNDNDQTKSDRTVDVVEDYTITAEDEYTTEDSDNSHFVTEDYEVVEEEELDSEYDLNRNDETYQIDEDSDQYDSYEDVYEAEEVEKETTVNKEREIGKIRIE